MVMEPYLNDYHTFRTQKFYKHLNINKNSWMGWRESDYSFLSTPSMNIHLNIKYQLFLFFLYQRRQNNYHSNWLAEVHWSGRIINTLCVVRVNTSVSVMSFTDLFCRVITVVFQHSRCYFFQKRQTMIPSRHFQSYSKKTHNWQNNFASFNW